VGAVTAREREVRIPRTQIGFEPDGERCVLDVFVKLKKMRMAFADADPDYFHHSFRRKCSNSFDGQKKGAKFDRLEFFAQGKIDILRDLGEKTEREMDLVDSGPAHAVNSRVESAQSFSNYGGRIDRNEETFRAHLPRTISWPAFASLPLWLTRGGKPRLKLFISRAIKLGKTAFAAMMRQAEKGMMRTDWPPAQAFTIFRAARSAEIDANGILRDQSNHRYSAA